MPTLFDQTWQDNAGDTVSASDLNSHAGEHSDALFDVAEAGTVIGGVGRDQPINITGSASVSKSNGEIVVDVTDTNTDTQLSNEQVEDIVAGRLSGGSNVTVTHDDPNNTITVDATDTNTDTRIETQAGGTTEYTDTSVVNFDTSSDISVTDNGSGKITVAASGGGGGGSVDTLDPTSAATPATNGGKSGALALGDGATAGGGDSGQNTIAIGENTTAESIDAGGTIVIGSGAELTDGAIGSRGTVLFSPGGVSVTGIQRSFISTNNPDAAASETSVIINQGTEFNGGVTGNSQVIIGKFAGSDGGSSVAVGDGEGANTKGVAIGSNASVEFGGSQGVAIGASVTVNTSQVARIGEGSDPSNPAQLVIPVSDTIADADLNNGEVAIRADSLSSPSQIEFRMKDTNGSLHTFTAT